MSLPLEPISYELAFPHGIKKNEADIELTSPLLDCDMHPTGTLPAKITNRRLLSRWGSPFALDSFHIESISAYLRGQGYIRRVLETELAEEWPPAAKSIWQQAKVVSLVVEQRNVPTAEHLAAMKTSVPTYDIEKAKSIADQPDTMSSFTLVLEVSWDEEHHVLARFRDGVLVSLTHD